jgi:replicative DNA helicase
VNQPVDPQLAAVRTPPHSIEAEQSVLGGLLIDNAAWDRIADLVGVPDFYRQDHKLIFGAISRLVDTGKPADAVTVYEALRNSGKADDAGGLVYLNTLAQNTPSAANIRRYAEIVRERSVLRRLVTAGDEIATSALNPAGRDTKQILDEAETKVFQIAEEGARGRQGFQEIQPLLTKVVERIQELFERADPSDVTGVPTGFTDLDSKTSGLQPGDLVIVAGRPAMGKTSLALNIGEHVAIDKGMPVAVFSMEMGAGQLALRMLSSVGRLDQQRLRTGRLFDEDWPKLTSAIQKMHEAPLFIDETPAMNSIDLRARARRLARTCGRLGLIIVDYLQLMSASSAGENRATEISEISRGLKALAKELAVPVIALSQLNRTVEQRTDKRPVMSDLRECVTGDTLVWLADGSRVPIADLVGTTPQVHAVTPSQRVVQAPADAVWAVGRKPVLCMKLASGRRLRATAKHRVLTGNGWKELGECAVGERVALARRVPEPVQARPWPEHELVLFAHLVGDGSYLRHQPLRYTTASEDNSRVVREAAEAMGSTVTRHAGRGQWHQLVIAGNGNRWAPAGVGAWLKRLGVHGQRSHEKHLPASLFQVPDGQVALFLRHLWATDGCISVRSTGSRGAARVYLSTCSEQLARDVAALLLRLGIVARLRWMAQRGGRPVWSVDVSGQDAQCRFLTVVGAFGPRAAPAEALRQVLATTQANTNVDTLPREVFEIAKREMTALGVSQRAMAQARGTSYGGSSHFRFSPSRAVVVDYARRLGSGELLMWGESDLFWDTVVGVEPEGEEEVYDLTVPGPACWLADGIVTHNSGAIEQDADLILFIYRDEVYNPDTNDKNVAEIIIGKQRNGPIGRVNLRFDGQYTRFENLARSDRGGYS